MKVEKLPEHVRFISAEGIRRIKLIDATLIGVNVRSTVLLMPMCMMRFVKYMREHLMQCSCAVK